MLPEVRPPAGAHPKFCPLPAACGPACAKLSAAGAACPACIAPERRGSRPPPRSAAHEHCAAPQSIDLAVVELTFNEPEDAPFTFPQRRGFERLLRKLARMPRSPAVVVLHHYAWCGPPNACLPACRCLCGICAGQSLSAAPRCGQPADDSPPPAACATVLLLRPLMQALLLWRRCASGAVLPAG